MLSLKQRIHGQNTTAKEHTFQNANGDAENAKTVKNKSCPGIVLSVSSQQYCYIFC